MSPGKAASSKQLLTLAQIDAIDDRAVTDVVVSAWNGTVRVQALTLQQINQCNRRAANESRGGEINPEVRNGWYLVEGMVEPKIDLAVAEKWLTERSAGPVSQILAEILTSSGLTERAVEDAKSTPQAEPDPALPTEASGTPG